MATIEKRTRKTGTFYRVRIRVGYPHRVDDPEPGYRRGQLPDRVRRPDPKRD